MGWDVVGGTWWSEQAGQSIHGEAMDAASSACVELPQPSRGPPPRTVPHSFHTNSRGIRTSNKTKLAEARISRPKRWRMCLTVSVSRAKPGSGAEQREYSPLEWVSVTPSDTRTGVTWLVGGTGRLLSSPLNDT
eukprot:7391675-Prymnesium_polylepis.1